MNFNCKMNPLHLIMEKSLSPFSYTLLYLEKFNKTAHKLISLDVLFCTSTFFLIKENWVGGGDQSGFPTWA
jgi:hypothetical protein